MYLLLLGIVLLAMKYLEVDPVAQWSWWAVLSPLAGAVVWWAWADWSGYTKREAVERETVDLAILDVNLKGTFNLCQSVLPVLVANGSGSIVNLSSSAAQRGGGLVAPESDDNPSTSLRIVGDASGCGPRCSSSAVERGLLRSTQRT